MNLYSTTKGMTEDARVAELVAPQAAEMVHATIAFAGNPLVARALGNPPADPSFTATRAWRGAEILAANGHGNARSVARVYAALACGGTLDGITLCRPETLARASSVAVEASARAGHVKIWALPYEIDWVRSSQRSPVSVACAIGKLPHRVPAGFHGNWRPAP